MNVSLPSRRRPGALRSCITAAGLVGVFAAAWLPTGAMAQDKFPERSIRVIVPFPAGGINDTVARPILKKMGDVLNTSFVVENRPGASGTIGTASASRADADGYSLLLGAASTMAVVPHMLAAGYSPIKDFAPVGGLASVPSVMISGKVDTYRDFATVVAAAKARPGMLTFGSAGAGTSHHTQMSFLDLSVGITMLHVPYKGGAPAMADMLGQQIDFLMEPLPTALQHVRSGKAVGLGISTAQRSPLLPNVPTFVELGVKDFLVSTWFGLFAPAKTPPATIAILNKALATALRDPEIVQAMTSRGIDPMPMTPTELAQYVVQENERWKSVVAQAKIGME